MFESLPSSRRIRFDPLVKDNNPGPHNPNPGTPKTSEKPTITYVLHVCHFLLRVLSDWLLNLHFSCGVKRVYQNPSSLEPTLLSRYASDLYLCRSLCSFSASFKLAVQTASSFSRSPSITCSAAIRTCSSCSICFRSLWAFGNSLTWRISSCSSSASSSTFGSWCGLC